MANHLTRSDRAFLASVSRDVERKQADAAELAEEFDAALEEAGIDPAELELEDVEGVEPSDHPDDVDALRHEVRGAIGALRRETAQIAREAATSDEQ